MEAAASTVNLKLLIDPKARKVLFAEAEKSFVDFLFHLLSLPLGSVIKLEGQNSMVRSLGNQYDIKDFGSLEVKDVHLGVDEGLNVLKAALHTDSVFSGINRLIPLHVMPTSIRFLTFGRPGI